MKQWKAVCDKCKHNSTCKRPCWFIEHLLSKVTDGSFEKQMGRNIVHFGHYWEKRFSDIHPSTLKKVVFEIIDETEPEGDVPTDKPFDDFEYQPEQKIADIFYMRFFLGLSYVEIGEKYGIDHREASGIYSQARKRVLEIVKILDGRDKGIKFLRRGRNRLTKHEKAFILNKVFGFAFREVAEVLGYAGPDAIQHTVNKMYQKYKEEFLKVEAS
jgi:hypothetical protein